MSQHDMTIDNAYGAAVRLDINAALQALASNNSGGSAPSVTFAGMTWLDTSTTPPTIKQRNQANSGWNGGLALSGSGGQDLILSGSGDATFGGRVGIGSPVYPSAIPGLFASTISAGSGQAITFNLYYAGGFKYRTNGYALSLTDPADGTFVWSVAGNNSSGSGASAPVTPFLKFDTAGNVLAVSGTGLLGYGAGSGGTVVQSTSKSTAVTLNKPSGQITMSSAALAGGAEVFFQVNNSLVSPTDSVQVNLNYNSQNYVVRRYYVGAGIFNVAVKNTSAGSLSEPIVIDFSIMKGSAS